jgi:hypothetical protein
MKPFYHTFLIYRIRQSTNSGIVDTATLREIIGRVSTRKAGLPRNFITFIIQDLLNLGLIGKIGNDVYRVGSKTKLEARIKSLMLCI